MKIYLFIIFVFLALACDESDEVATRNECATSLALMNNAADKFDSKSQTGTATKADCNSLIERMNDYLPCMQEGEDKVGFMSAITDFSELCSALPS